MSPVTDPERLKVRVAPAKFFSVTDGKAQLCLFFENDKDPELLVSEEIARDPGELVKTIAWAKGELQSMSNS